ncbi:MAG: acyl-CoA thioesterase [Pseudomonadota bacterium]|nr:acyl-CoA thioesterase [Pseudomonadota bacterium]
MSKSYKYDIRVDWGDCDPAGIVFYPNFYRWMDRGFWLHFGSQKLTLEKLRQRYQALGGPLVDTGASFLKAAKPGDILTVISRIEEWGTKSFRMEYDFYKEGTTMAKGFEVRVWGILDKNGSITTGPIPREIKDLFL